MTEFRNNFDGVQYIGGGGGSDGLVNLINTPAPEYSHIYRALGPVAFTPIADPPAAVKPPRKQRRTRKRMLPASSEATPLDVTVESFWPSVNQMVETADKAYLKSFELPLARVKKIVKMDEAVKMISFEASPFLAKVSEFFICDIALRSWVYTQRSGRRTLQRSDISAAVSRNDIYDFLIDIVPREDVKTTKALSSPQRITAASVCNTPVAAAAANVESRETAYNPFVEARQPIVADGVQYIPLQQEEVDRLLRGQLSATNFNNQAANQLQQYMFQPFTIAQNTPGEQEAANLQTLTLNPQTPIQFIVPEMQQKNQSANDEVLNRRRRPACQTAKQRNSKRGRLN